MKKNILALFSIFSLISFSGISGMEQSEEERKKEQRGYEIEAFTNDERLPNYDLSMLQPDQLKPKTSYMFEGQLCDYLGRDKISKDHFTFRNRMKQLLVLVPHYEASAMSHTPRKFLHWDQIIDKSDSEQVKPIVAETL